MKTGLESLDTGAPEITYSGNQGPKSPKEDQQKMAEFKLQEYMEEFERVFPDMKDKRGTPDYMEELKDYFEGLASKQSEGISDMAMDTGEPKMEMPEEMREMAADGGIMRTAFQGGGRDAGAGSNLRQEATEGYEAGLFSSVEEGIRQLLNKKIYGVQEMADGGIMRTAFQGGGRDAGAGSNFGSENFGGGGDNNREQYGASGQYTRDKDTSFTTADQDRNQRETIARNIAANKEIERQKQIDEINKSIKEAYKNPFNKAIDKIKTFPSDFRTLGLKNLVDQKMKNKTAYPGFTSMLNVFNPSMVDEDYTYDSEPTEDMLGVNIQDYMDTEYGLTGKNMTDIDRINRALDQGRKTGNISQAEFEAAFFGPKGKPVNDNRDGPPIILPPVMPMDGGADLDPEELGTEFISQFTRNALTDADKARVSGIGGKSIFLADGGRASYADGGITDLRQGYFLGKLVKKATRGLKKIIKSPIGKLALMYGGAKLGGGLFGKTKFGFMKPGSKFFSGLPTGKGFTGQIFDKLLRSKDSGYTDFDPFKVGILGASALTGLYAKGDQDDEPSLDEYMKTANRGPSINPIGIRQMIAANKGNINPQDFAFLNPSYYAADGGRIGLAAGGIGELRGALSKQMFGYGDDDEDDIKKLAMGGSAGMPPVTMQTEGQNIKAFNDDESINMAQRPQNPMPMPMQKPMMNPMMDPRMMQQMMMASKMNPQMMSGRMMAAMGGRMGFAEGGDEGELLNMGGMEKDYRNEGGFVPMGEYERKDDVPARLSKNEFVFTADAVRNAGGGDIDKGAEIMENMMENLEAGGKVSEASQGLSGAREMFATQQRLGEVL